MKGAILDLTLRELLTKLEDVLRINPDYAEGADGVAHWRHGSFFVCADASDYLEIPMRGTKSRSIGNIKIRFEVVFHKAPKESKIELFRVYRRHRTAYTLGTLVLDAEAQKLRLSIQKTPGQVTTRSCDFRPEPEVRYSVRYLLDMHRKLCRVSLKLADGDLEPADGILYKNLQIPGIYASSLRLVVGRKPAAGNVVSPVGAEFSDLEFVAGTKDRVES